METMSYLPDMVGQVGGLEGAFEDVVAPITAFGGDVWLDLNTRAFQVEESAKFVEVSAVSRADIEYGTGRGSESGGHRSGPVIGP